jgi:phosphoserine phosphatase RsbU/P
VTIRTKFSLSSLIVLALLAVLIDGGLIFLVRAKEEVAAGHKMAASLVRAVGDIRGHWLQVNDEVNDLIRRGYNAKDFDQYKAAIENYVESLKKLEFMIPMAPELEILQTGLNMVVELSVQIATLVSTDSHEPSSIHSAIVAAIGERADALDALGDEIEEDLLGLIKKAEQRESLAVEHVERLEAFIRMFALAIFGMIFLVIGGQYRLILRPITNSIQKLVFGATEIGKKNLDYRLDIHTRDEIEQLGHEFNQMAANVCMSYRAIEAAKEQIEAYSQALKGELDKGRQLQQDFLPYGLPQPPGWDLAASLKPARDVSGDFYDAFILPDNLVAIVIGDVCDKGVGSALFMALCRSLLRIFSIRLDPDSFAMQIGDQASGIVRARNPQLATSSGPTNLLNAVVFTNSYIAQTHSHTNMFTTLFFGILDPATGILRYINGGHEPPAILGAGGIKARLTPTGPAVGLFPDVSFEVRQIDLEAGDMLLAYTDGVTDARNPSGERFTQERLLLLLEQPLTSAAALLDTVESCLQVYIADAVQFDDITLLAVRRARAAEAS